MSRKRISKVTRENGYHIKTFRSSNRKHNNEMEENKMANHMKSFDGNLKKTEAPAENPDVHTEEAIDSVDQEIKELDAEMAGRATMVGLIITDLFKAVSLAGLLLPSMDLKTDLIDVYVDDDSITVHVDGFSKAGREDGNDAEPDEEDQGDDDPDTVDETEKHVGCSDTGFLRRPISYHHHSGHSYRDDWDDEDWRFDDEEEEWVYDED